MGESFSVLAAPSNATRPAIPASHARRGGRRTRQPRERLHRRSLRWHRSGLQMGWARISCKHGPLISSSSKIIARPSSDLKKLIALVVPLRAKKLRSFDESGVCALRDERAQSVCQGACPVLHSHTPRGELGHARCARKRMSLPQSDARRNGLPSRRAGGAKHIYKGEAGVELMIIFLVLGGGHFGLFLKCH